MDTLEDVLLARGEPPVAPGHLCDCPQCGHTCAYFSLLSVAPDPRFAPHEFVCSGCYVAAAAESPAPVAPWDSDQGAALKGQRNMELDRVRWTIMPDSPLDDPSKAAWLAYLQQLHRMTIDCSDPADWQWPAPPPLDYPQETTT